MAHELWFSHLWEKETLFKYSSIYGCKNFIFMWSHQSRQASAEPELFSRQTSALHMASKPDSTSRQLQQLQGSPMVSIWWFPHDKDSMDTFPQTSLPIALNAHSKAASKCKQSQQCITVFMLQNTDQHFGTANLGRFQISCWFRANKCAWSSRF